MSGPSRRGDRSDRPTARHWLSAFLIAAPMLAIGNAAVGWAEQTIDTGTASLIIASVPLWMALLDRVFYAQRLARTMVIGLVVGFGGVGLLVAPGGSGAGDSRAILLVFSSLAWALGSLYSRQAPQPQRPLVAAAMQMTAGGLILAVVSAVSGEAGGFHVSQVSLESWLGLAYLVVAGSLIAYTAYMWLLREVPDLARRDVCVREPGGRGHARDGGPRRAADLADARRRRSHPRLGRADRQRSEAARSSGAAAGRCGGTRPLTSLDMTVFDLRNIRVRSGEEHREAVEVAIAPIELGGERYVAVPEKVPAELSVTRASTGIVLGLRLSVRLHGPCVRCLADAVVDESLRLSEYQATSPGLRTS